MTLTWRLVLSFTLVALFAAAVTAMLGHFAAVQHFERYLAAPAVGSDSAHASHVLADRHASLLSSLRSSGLLSALVALLVATVAGAFLAYGVVRPVRELTGATRAYRRGERSFHANVRGRDELAELSRAFRDLTVALDAERERERRLTADVAHELRTPLTVMRTELEALQDGLLDATPETHGRLLEEAELLSRLVEDLRLLSLAEAGELPMNVREVDVSRLAAQVVAAFETRAAQAGVQLQTELVPARSPGDPERLRQVLHNLLENAVRHSPKGGAVRVRLVAAGETLVLDVLDEGPGVPPEHLPHLFDRFYRADRVRSRELGGSGLGLSIVRAIAQAHGGTASAANRDSGGALFRVELPRT